MDTVGNMLTAIVNAQRVGKERVMLPYSRLNEKLADFLAQQKRIATFRVEEGSPSRLVVTLKYEQPAAPTIRGMRRISRPGARQYLSREALPYPTHGEGLYIISTSQGLMSETQARRAGMGGEIMGEIW